MRDILKWVRWFILFIILFVVSVDVYATDSTENNSGSGTTYTIDNNGNPRDNPYGKNESIPSSFVGVDYYDCYIPYSKTVEEIGGICTSIGSNNPDGYYAMPDYVKTWRVGDRTNYQGDYAAVNGVSRVGYDDTGCSIYTDSNGTKYYAMAVQKFFYNKDGAYFGWSTANRGQILDVIFTDGTVVHFIVGDANAEQHTNGWSGGFVNEADFICNTLNYTQYKYLFSCMSGNCFELWGGSSACANGFLNKFGLKSDGSGNHVAYYRMYNAKISDPPQRSSGVPTDVSYSLGNVTIDDTTPDSGANNPNTTQESENTYGFSTDLWVAEKDLNGMPNMIDLTEKATQINLPDGSELSNSESNNVVQIREDLSMSTTEKVLTTARVFVVLAGLLLYLYAIFLIVAYLFDRSNNFIDISLLSVMTLGVISKDKGIFEEENEGLNRILKISFVCFIVGSMLIAGTIYSVIGRIITFVRGLL